MASRWHANPALLGMLPYPSIPPAIWPRGAIAAQLLPPFAPGLYLTNIPSGPVFAWVASSSVPNLWSALHLVEKWEDGPFPYGFPVVPDAPYP